MRELGNALFAIKILNVFTIIFVILKITGVTVWSWFWVLLPTLVYYVLFAVFVISAYVIAKVDEIRFVKDIGKNKGDKGQ